MAQYLDKAGLQVLWTKVKNHDTSTLTAAKNDATEKDVALKNELTGVINGVNADVTTLKGYFTKVYGKWIAVFILTAVLQYIFSDYLMLKQHNLYASHWHLLPRFFQYIQR